MLMASPTGRVVYRVLEVWRVRRACDHRHGFRLVCARLSRDEVPEGAEVLPWPRDPRAPRQNRRTRRLPRPSADPAPPEPPAARLDRIRAKSPLLLELVTEPTRRAKAAAETAQLARARHVGRDLGVVNRSGHGIRLWAIRALPIVIRSVGTCHSLPGAASSSAALDHSASTQSEHRGQLPPRCTPAPVVMAASRGALADAGRDVLLLPWATLVVA
jgi:hypothetical protein